MILFPAVDIQQGKVVRLVQGRFDDVTCYEYDPVDAAKKWESLGAQWLHLVDLDGAKTGAMNNFDSIAKIAQTVKIPVQVGGGIRSEEVIHDLLTKAKVNRVILGTKIVEDRAFLKTVLARWKERIVVSLDCSNGFVAQRGWTSTTTIKASELVKELEADGLKVLIYTDIARDGMLTGPNYQAIEEMLASSKIPFIASGGIGSIDDIKKLKTFTPRGLIGAITGKAIYEGKLDFQEALTLCSTNA